MTPYEGARYEGEWIHPDDDDIGRGKAGQPVQHHKYWDLALDSAVSKVPRSEKGPFAVERYVTVDHDSPGWVDGYKIDLGT
jgi:hypothetical protein